MVIIVLMFKIVILEIMYDFLNLFGIKKNLGMFFVFFFWLYIFLFIKLWNMFKKIMYKIRVWNKKVFKEIFKNFLVEL